MVSYSVAFLDQFTWSMYHFLFYCWVKFHIQVYLWLVDLVVVVTGLCPLYVDWRMLPWAFSLKSLWGLVVGNWDFESTTLTFEEPFLLLPGTVVHALCPVYGWISQEDDSFKDSPPWIENLRWLLCMVDRKAEQPSCFSSGSAVYRSH